MDRERFGQISAYVRIGVGAHIRSKTAEISYIWYSFIVEYGILDSINRNPGDEYSMFYNAKEKLLEIQDIQMNYITFGKGEKPLILIQGLSTVA